MVFYVDHEDPSGGIDRYPKRMSELTRSTSERTPLSQERATAGELLHTVVSDVRDIHVAGGIDRNVRGPFELAAATSGTAPLENERSIVRELEHFAGNYQC